MKIFVVSHDAGGANILASLIKKYKDDFDWSVYALGPAKNIFLSEKVDLGVNLIVKAAADIKAVLNSKQPDLVLTGTSWGSSLETDFIKAAKNNNIKTACFLDHWINYPERFGSPKSWKKNLPGAVFVGDKWAYKIALKKGFPKKSLFQVKNPYFEEIIKKSKKIKLLYLSEAIHEAYLKAGNNSNSWVNVEYNSIKDLLRILRSQTDKSLIELKIRLHPAEKVNKYSHLLKDKKNVKIKKFVSISNPVKNLLVDDCLWADLVISSDSMAMFVALIIGKKVISYLPIAKQTCSLPQGGIKKINFSQDLTKEIRTFTKKANFNIIKNDKSISKKSFKTVITRLINLSNKI